MKIFEAKYMQHIVAIFLFLIVSGVYFFPETQGKKIVSHDEVSSVAATKEVSDYQDNEETILWTSRLFSGMPVFQVAYGAPSNLFVHYIDLIYQLPISFKLFFSLLLGFYFALSILKHPMPIRIIGSIAFALSSWFLLSIEGGHSTKILAISFIPILIASMLSAYKGDWFKGGLGVTVSICLMILVNHLQIVYFSIFFILAIVLMELYNAFKNKTLPSFIKYSLILFGFGILGVIPNVAQLWSNYEYSKETIRGGQSELTSVLDKTKGSGLDMDYAMRWSLGKTESLNILIPGLYAPGHPLDTDSETFNEFRKRGIPKNQAKEYIKGVPVYYGEQPFTTGPSYVGAAILFLFFLMFFIYDGRLKWALLAITILSLVFAWGRHFLIVNEFFFDYFPLFNKFRTPSMWLSLLMITTVWGAVISLTYIFSEKVNLQKLKKGMFYSGGILGGFCLIMFLMGSSLIDFNGPQDVQLEKNGFPMDSIIQDRMNILSSDSLRSLIVIALIFGSIWLFITKKIKDTTIAYLIVGAIIIGDLWLVDKRYVNNDDFKKAKSIAKTIKKSAADEQILNDKELNFRVFNTTVSSFNDNTSSYFHKSVGGYSAAKLYRYQDLIENHLSKGNMNVFNMLNAKYFISNQEGQQIVQQNPNALGSVWFINNIEWAEDADEEMLKLTNFNPSNTAVIDARFKTDVALDSYNKNSGEIELSSFHPDKMTYKSNATQDNFAVFSEIWYKGNIDWKAYIDGKEVKFVRANYLLRALKIPKGEHEIVFKFYPNHHYTGQKIGYAGSFLVILLIVFYLAKPFLTKKISLPSTKE